MGQTQYGFVRDYGSGTSKDYDLYRQLGLGGILYNTEDPRFAEGYQAAQNSGFAAGAWMPAHPGEDPITYARRLAAYAQKYHPSMLVPNVEFVGKGYKGSPGWDWSEQMMKEFRRLSPDQQLAVSVMGNQDDFNYEAYTGRGSQVWAQAYAGDMTPMDPNALYQQLVRRGVDPSLINITLGPQGRGYGGAYSLYALDDVTKETALSLGQRLAAARGQGLPAVTAQAATVAGRDPTPDILARTNRNATDARLLGANTTGHILTQKEVNALTPKALAVQHVVKPPTKARTAARKIVKKTVNRR